MSTTLRAVLFDMDGLLIDSEDLHMRAFAATGAELGYAREPREYSCWIGHSAMELAEWMVERIETKIEPAELLRREQEAFLNILRQERPTPLPGVREMFDGCDTLGLARGLVSSTFYHQVVKTMAVVLEHLEREPVLESHFRTVVTGDRVKNLKPNPEPYAKAAAGLGLKPEQCMVFEDSPAGVTSARAAGCKVVAIPNLYLKHEEIAPLAHAHFPTLREAYSARVWERW